MSSAQPAPRLAVARSGQAPGLAAARPAQARLTGAEVLAVTALAAVSGLIVWSYLLDRLGVSLLPSITGAASAVTAALVGGAFYHRAERAATDMVLFVVSVAAMAGYLVWLAWPHLLPTGSGPDLTHHLLLIDYIERQGHLVRDPQAGAALGEMAHYTPGMHLLTVVVAAFARTDGFHVVYPVVVCSVALKLGFVTLILLRLLAGSTLRAPLAAAGALLVFAIPTFTISSFTHDSFLAQVVSELFAIALWWTSIVWDRYPTLPIMTVFAMAAAGAFLTWPVWVGPPVLSLLILISTRRDLSLRTRIAHLGTALGPVVLVVVVHAIGRTEWISLVATSGAVEQPSVAVLGWWFVALAFGGVVIASVSREYRVVTVFAAATAIQAGVLWLVAKRAGAHTAYMAIKMTYLAIYPAIVSAIVALAALWAWSVRIAHVRRLPPRAVEGVAWLAVVAVAIVVARHLGDRPLPKPVVSDDLWTVATWARDHLPAHCVDYLVGNEYTAYWLHLAVLGNARTAARTADDDTFRVQPSMARWLVADGLKYAVVDLSVLPAEIRRDIDVLQQVGNAAVITRRGSSSCP